ncbi:hypothetical protein [Streptomyces sp. NEAU-YJ-81]|uniref:hypothetical protein n=1 Tax=Streptomyces sp. NEAU-YJ-81 TaxID=2820288 RepID=UPI001ABCE68F|nr:hypothetical protein [Streptomyces sp. NEAU-YJ-81]MBO3677507.1 hypothetical protein [Streptomyces sp. NEAU-YJ-81]
MTTTDYLISVALILLVIPQLRGTRQTTRNTLLPVVAVAAAAAHYLRSFPTQGHDVQLYLVGVLAGAVLGAACGATTGVHRGSDGVALAKAGAVAAGLWIVGMASRAGFEYWTTHGGSTTVAQFSRDNLITGSAAWTAALLLMALAQVLSRLAVVRIKVRRMSSAAATPVRA